MTMMLQPIAMQKTMFVARDFHDADLELIRLRMRRADERLKNNIVNLNNTSSLIKPITLKSSPPPITTSASKTSTQDSSTVDDDSNSNSDSNSSENLDRDYVTSTAELNQLRLQRQTQTQTQRHNPSVFVAPDTDFLTVEKELANFRLIKAMQKLDRQNNHHHHQPHSLSETVDRDYAVAAADVLQYRQNHPLPIEIARDFYKCENELAVLRLHKSTLKSKAKAKGKSNATQPNKSASAPVQSYAFDRDFNTAATELTYHRTNMTQARALVITPDVDFLEIEQQLANYRLIKKMQKADAASSSSSSSSSSSTPNERLDRNYSTAAVELTQYRISHPLPVMVGADRDFAQADNELALLRRQQTANQKQTTTTTTANQNSGAVEHESLGIDRDYSIATRDVEHQRANPRPVARALPDPDVDIVSIEKELANYRLVKAIRKADQQRMVSSTNTDTTSSSSSSSLVSGTDRDYAYAEEELKQYRIKFPQPTLIPIPTTLSTPEVADADRDFLTAESELTTFRFIKAMQKFDKQRQTASSSSSSPSPSSTLFDRDFNVAEQELVQYRVQHSQGSPLDRDCVTAEAELAAFRHRKEETRRLQQQLRELQQQQHEQQQQQASKNQTPKELSRRSSISDVQVELVSLSASPSPSPYDFMPVSVSPTTNPTPISTFNDRDFAVAEQELIYLRRAR